MANLHFSNLARSILMIVSGALIAWALIQMFSVSDDVAELEVRVENANLRLRAEEYLVQVSDTVSGALMAEAGPANPGPLRLAPGTYDVRVTLPGVWPHRPSSRQAVELAGGRRTHLDFDFSYGELTLNIEGLAEAEAEAAEVFTVQVFSDPRGDSPLISFAADEGVKLAAGRYDLRVVRTVETNEKHVQWLEDVVIEPGRRRNVSAAFERGFVLVNVTNAGEPIPPNHATVTFFAAGDESQRIVESGPVNAPIYLPTGTYDLHVTYEASNDRPVREARSVIVADGETNNVSITFDSGEIVVHAFVSGGEALTGYDVYTYVYSRSDHRSAIAYATAGTPLRVSAGRYDVRANLFRSANRPDSWARDVEVSANESSELEAIFDVGEIVVRVLGEEGRELSGDEYAVSIYPDGNRTRAVHRMQAGAHALVAPGAVELLLENTYTGATEWLAAEITAGETTEVLVDER